MEVFVAWLGLGGGIVMMLIALVAIVRLQARTKAERPRADGGPPQTAERNEHKF